MKNLNIRKLWCVFLALSLILTSCLTLGVSAEEAEIEQTQPIEPTEPENNGAAPDNEGVDPEGGDVGEQPEDPVEPEQGVDVEREPEVDENGFVYLLNAEGTEYSVIGYEGTATELEIPATYNGLPVTSIGENAFEWHTDLTSVTIPSNVTSIGTYAFGVCTSMTNITISEGVTNIGYMAFADCRSLMSVTLPASVTNIEGNVFVGCAAMTSITVDEGNEVYHSENNCLIETASKTLIAGCQTSIIPTDGSVTSIGNSAFSSCYNLTSITIPASVRNIGDYAFEWCPNLTNIILSEGLISIGDDAFPECSSLTSITIPASVTSLGSQVFYNCDNLTSVTIEGVLEYAGWYVFGDIDETCTVSFAQKEPAPAWENAWDEESGATFIWGDLEFVPTYSSEGLIYELNEEGTEYSVTGCEEASRYVEIPAMYEGLPVTRIGEDAFWDCDELVDVIIPNSVTSIGAWAFQSCRSLQSIAISGSVTSIGMCAFAGCTNLTSIMVSANNVAYHSTGNCLIETASKTLIAGCANSVIPMDGSVTSIGNYAFVSCDGLTSVTIPAGVTSIGYGAFSSCYNLESITIPNSVTSIGEQAFSWCDSLTSITFEGIVDYVGWALFDGVSENCTITFAQNEPTPMWDAEWNANCAATIVWGDLEWVPTYSSEGLIYDRNAAGTEYSVVGYEGRSVFVEIPAIHNGLPVTSIADDAFWYCVNLTSVIIPDSVTKIGREAFFSCHSLTSVTIPDSVTSIGNRVFAYCESLTSVTFEGILDYVGWCVFDGIGEDCTISFAQNEPTPMWDSEWNADCSAAIIWGDLEWVPTYSSEGLIYELNEEGTEYSVVGYEGVSALVEIPATYDGLPVTSIGECAFEYCSAMMGIIIPDSVKSIGDYAFSECYNLTDITLPEGLKSIGRDVLQLAPITSLSIPSSVTDIALSAFVNCQNLASITVQEGNTVYHSAGNCLIETESKTLIAGCKNSVIPADGSVTSIGEDAFFGCDSLTTMAIPEGIISIGTGAFFACYGLESITLPESLTSIGASAFSNCIALESIHIPASVTDIGLGVLSYCESLAEITVDVENTAYVSVENCLIETESKTLLAVCNDSVIPNDGSIEHIGQEALTGLRWTSIVIPEGVISIGSNAASYCYNLTELILPESLTSIGIRAFYRCEALTDVTLPSNLKSIGFWAFADCEGLTDIIIPESVTNIGIGAFSGCLNLTSVTIQSFYTTIAHNFDTIPETATIYGYEGSTAQAYAERYGREFVAWELPGTEGLIYELNAAGTEYSVKGYEGTDVHIIIPKTYNGLPVTRVTKDAFTTKTQGGGGVVELPPDILVPRGMQAAPNAAAVADNVKLQSITLLSPTVILEDSKNTIPAGVAVYGYLGSTAEAYAAKYSRSFAALDGLEFTYDPDSEAYILTGYAGERTSVTIPATYFGLPVIAIGEYAFEGMAELTEVILPDSIIYIDEGAFFRTGLTDFTVPKNVIYIGLGALCSNDLTSLDVAQGNPIYYSTQNCIIEIETGTLVAGCKNSVIPDDGSVIAIGDAAFAYGSVTSIVIPDSVTAIGFCAFYECSELESVTFGADSQLTVLGESAFDGCCSLSNIVLPAGLVEIGDYAFYCCCSLTEITIGAAVECIGERAFDECTGLTKIIIRSDDVDIFDDEYTIPETTVICGTEGSTAQAYADKYGRTFEPISAFLLGDVNGNEEIETTDAIYLLYNVIFGEAGYPISQPCDFNGDGEKTVEDAIYLLYRVIFGEGQYPLH